MILTGSQIAREVAEGSLHIDEFDPSRLEPNSYGFRLGPEMIRYDQAELDCAKPPAAVPVRMGPEGRVLEPGRFYLGRTMEAMGSGRHAATLYANRSVATLGIWIQFSAPLGHVGAVLPWTLEISAIHPARVYPGMVIGKIAFWAVQGAPSAYAGKYTGSTSAVASRLSLEEVRPPTGSQVGGHERP